jgi:uncharacterized protein YcaQ
VVPPPEPGSPTDRPGQFRALIDRAARAHGVASPACLADYFRMPAAETRLAVAELVEAGVLVPVQVSDWPGPLYRHRGARLPRRLEARALLVAFDPLIFHRRRVEALFGMRYRLEYYLPAPQRVHGYYVMPFLLGDQLVARVDLKADRRASRLLVRAALAEPGVRAGAVTEALAQELVEMAGWLGLAQTVVEADARGDLAAGLAVRLG